MKANTVCDNWKLPIYRSVLRDAGYSWTEKSGIRQITKLTITHEVGGRAALANVVRECERRAQMSKPREP